MQRRKTCPSEGEEIGLKAASQPSGICRRGCERTGDSTCPGPSARLEVERRSPLRVRFTKFCRAAAGRLAPVVGNDGKEIRAAEKRAIEIMPAAPANRIDSISRIGSSPSRPNPPVSLMRAALSWPAHRKRARARPVPRRPAIQRVCEGFSRLRDELASRPMAHQIRSEQNEGVAA